METIRAKASVAAQHNLGYRTNERETPSCCMQGKPAEEAAPQKVYTCPSRVYGAVFAASVAYSQSG